MITIFEGKKNNVCVICVHRNFAMLIDLILLINVKKKVGGAIKIGIFANIIMFGLGLGFQFGGGEPGRGIWCFVFKIMNQKWCYRYLDEVTL